VHCVALSCLLGVLALLWVLDAVGICLVGTGELHNLCNRLFLVLVVVTTSAVVPGTAAKW